MKLVWQININDYDEIGNGKFINTSKLKAEDNKERKFPLRVIDINVDKLRDMEYTKLKEGAEDSLEKLLYVFICPDEEKRNKLYNANEIMEKVCNKIDSLTDEFTLYYDHDEYVQNIGYEVGEKRGKEEGFKEGIKVGRKQATYDANVETAKNLIKIGILTDEQIATSTTLSLDEIEKLKEKMNK